MNEEWIRFDENLIVRSGGIAAVEYRPDKGIFLIHFNNGQSKYLEDNNNYYISRFVDKLVKKDEKERRSGDDQ